MANKNNKENTAPKGAAEQADQAGATDNAPLTDPQGGAEQQTPGVGDASKDPESKDLAGVGVKQGDGATSTKEEKQENPPAPTTTKSKFQERCEVVAQEYAPHYPASKAFHFCSDMQVFLEGDKADANAHQLAVNPRFKVFTVNL